MLFIHYNNNKSHLAGERPIQLPCPLSVDPARTTPLAPLKLVEPEADKHAKYVRPTVPADQPARLPPFAFAERRRLGGPILPPKAPIPIFLTPLDIARHRLGQADQGKHAASTLAYWTRRASAPCQGHGPGFRRVSTKLPVTWPGLFLLLIR
jgi:hypothetical protein